VNYKQLLRTRFVSTKSLPGQPVRLKKGCRSHHNVCAAVLLAGCNVGMKQFLLACLSLCGFDR